MSEVKTSAFVVQVKSFCLLIQVMQPVLLFSSILCLNNDNQLVWQGALLSYSWMDISLLSFSFILYKGYRRTKLRENGKRIVIFSQRRKLPFLYGIYIIQQYSGMLKSERPKTGECWNRTIDRLVFRQISLVRISDVRTNLTFGR